jgi:predicted Rossmann fold nucleotide-binding protein DprA/Smf involved in DNA uptake
MTLSSTTQAVLLLTAHFSKSGPKDLKPLGPVEWGRFALWLKQQGKSPEDLLTGDLEARLAGLSDKTITVDRIKRLLERGSALAIATEKWLRSGLWILTRSDAEYPRILKERLKESSPPILFGCGNARLLSRGGVAVVGSRNAAKDDLDYAAKLGAAAAAAGKSIVSGGAKGVDEAAMLGALQVEGTAIGVLADSLLRASSSQKYREYLTANNLVLVSPNQPEASFSVGNAMGRNKYIYCLSDAAVVVHSGTTGGTITGATENLKKGWVPLWVKKTNDSKAGNAEIVRQGGNWVSDTADTLDMSSVLGGPPKPSAAAEEGDLFASKARDDQVRSKSAEAGPQSNARRLPEGATEFYDLFLIKIHKACSQGARSPGELEEELDIKKTQLDVWLKKAVDEKILKKLSRPVRYELLVEDPQQSIFAD